MIDQPLHPEDARQILEYFGFEATRENVGRLLQNRSTVLRVAVKTILDGTMDPSMESGTKEVIQSILNPS